MNEGEKAAILEIVKISLENEYLNQADISSARDLFQKKKDLAATVFGARYIRRLEKLLDEENSEDICILCKKNVAGNCVICGECVGKIYPMVEAEEKRRASSGEGNHFAESKRPKEIADTLAEYVNAIQVENDKDYAQIQFVEYGSYHNIFLNTECFTCICNYNQSVIATLAVSHIYHRTVEVELVVRDFVWQELLTKVLIEMMEPELNEDQIDEIYHTTVDESPYFYMGLYYESESEEHAFHFVIGTESYQNDIASHVRSLKVDESKAKIELSDLFEKDSLDDFIKKFKHTESKGTEIILDRSIHLSLKGGKLQSVRMEGLAGYQLMGICYGQSEEEMTEQLENVCSNVYKTSISGYKSRYKHKGKLIREDMTYGMEVTTFCGFVSDVYMTRK